jgi:hypothetical protein
LKLLRLQKKNFEINQINLQMEKFKQANIEANTLINKLNGDIKDKKTDIFRYLEQILINVNIEYIILFIYGRLEKKINQLTDEYNLKLQVSEKMIENLKVIHKDLIFNTSNYN